MNQLTVNNIDFSKRFEWESEWLFLTQSEAMEYFLINKLKDYELIILTVKGYAEVETVAGKFSLQHGFGGDFYTHIIDFEEIK